MLEMGKNQDPQFHYGTHYSSPGIIYHYLLRMSPYTEGAILLQNGKFDFADRLFFSISDSYHNATTEYSDVRELVPELYTIPEVYLNLNKLDFGLMQNKKRVHNLELPGWAKDNPYLYISKMRIGMESEYVSKELSDWIDLIFGYKQRGEEAINNLNCFFYLTYEDSVDWDSIENPKELQSIESQILNFGQTPSQLLTKPHPCRSDPFEVRPIRSLCDPGAQVRIYRPTKKPNLLSE